MGSLLKQLGQRIGEGAAWLAEWLGDNQASVGDWYIGLMRWVMPALALGILLSVLLDMLRDHLAYRLYRDRQLSLYEPHKYTIVEAAREFGLTGREEMVLQCIMDGKDKEEICEELSISINTFKKHSLNIYRKLQVNNRVQLFKKVLEKE